MQRMRPRLDAWSSPNVLRFVAPRQSLRSGTPSRPTRLAPASRWPTAGRPRPLRPSTPSSRRDPPIRIRDGAGRSTPPRSSSGTPTRSQRTSVCSTPKTSATRWSLRLLPPVTMRPNTTTMRSNTTTSVPPTPRRLFSAERTTSAPRAPRTTSTSPVSPAGPASASSSARRGNADPPSDVIDLTLSSPPPSQHGRAEATTESDRQRAMATPRRHVDHISSSVAPSSSPSSSSGSTDFIVGSPTSSFDAASYSPSSTSCPSSVRMADSGSSWCSSPSSRNLSTSPGLASPTSLDAASASSTSSVRFVDIASSPLPLVAASSPPGQDVVLEASRGRSASSSATGSVYSSRPRSESSTSDMSVDSAPPSPPSPAHSVPSVIVISDDESDTDRPRVDAAAPDTARPAAPAPRPASSVKKPTVRNFRTRKYRIVVPPELREVLRDWRASARIVKNEAIRLANMAEQHSHPNLKPFRVMREIVNNGSDFVRERPHLAKCPTYIRRQVVIEAISARKSILTQHYNKPRSQRGPIPTISPSTARRDKRQGFSLALDPQSGSIDFEVAEARAPRRAANDTAPASTPGRHERRITSLTLKIAPRHVRRRGASLDVKICLRGQRQRQFLVDSCNVRGMGRGDKYQMPHEWLIQCDRYSRWYLVVYHKVASDADFEANKLARQDRGGETTLQGTYHVCRSSCRCLSPLLKTVPPLLFSSGSVRVKSCDPGVRTPYSIYTSEGETIDIGDDADKDRLHRLRLEMDELKSRRHKTRPLDRRPSRNISRKKRAKRKRFMLNSKERQDVLGKQLRVSEKIRNLVTDLHCRTANFLAVSSDVVVMPRMEVGRMISRKGGLAVSTKRQLKGWSHAKFIDRLATKCHDVQFDPKHQRPRETVLLVQPEAYTSKTCGRCGVLNERLGSNRVFECPNPGCGYVADRDHNGAFNMIVKAIR
ncbi:uncharacterized protein SRS1_25029 [Sporisorium reilianum f. sp. reilianum]|uniref:Cas12f1-like TNB domain-containing protein n=1 Tax=Sporisorium reilianum f. sp. reilianum TaxID=72559 RepID=A0A2N8UJZ0_9BASI|nr:uncharacterized protein SRS1_25029 [Sporisorium reilianum f. sp. reilianum]